MASVQKTKRSYQSYDPDKLRLAIAAVEWGTPLRKAAKDFTIARTTLQNHVNGESVSTKLGAPTTFSNEEELVLIDTAKLLADHGLPPSKLDFRRMGKWFLMSKNRQSRFPNNMPTNEWLR